MSGGEGKNAEERHATNNGAGKDTYVGDIDEVLYCVGYIEGIVVNPYPLFLFMMLDIW